MKEIINEKDCSKYFYKEQLEQMFDYIENEIKKSNFLKDLDENYEDFQKDEKIYIGLIAFPNVHLINEEEKNISIEYKVSLKFGLPALSIMRITIYDEIDDHFLDKMIDYKEVIKN